MLQCRCLFKGKPCIFQLDNATSHTASVKTAWLHSSRVKVLDWPTHSSDLSPTENIWTKMKCKIWQRRPQLRWAARILYQIRMGGHSFSQRSNILSPQFPDVCRLSLNEEGKTWPRPTYFETLQTKDEQIFFRKQYNVSLSTFDMFDCD